LSLSVGSGVGSSDCSAAVAEGGSRVVRALVDERLIVVVVVPFSWKTPPFTVGLALVVVLEVVDVDVDVLVLDDGVEVDVLVDVGVVLVVEVLVVVGSGVDVVVGSGVEVGV
jgi:hypothetical protein